MPLDNRTIEKLNEMTAMVVDKSRLDESGIKYVKDVFADIVRGGGYYDTEEIESWLEMEKSWTDSGVRSRIVNLAHYVQSKHEQSDKLRMIGEDSCGCGS